MGLLRGRLEVFERLLQLRHLLLTRRVQRSVSVLQLVPDFLVMSPQEGIVFVRSKHVQTEPVFWLWILSALPSLSSSSSSLMSPAASATPAPRPAAASRAATRSASASCKAYSFATRRFSSTSALSLASCSSLARSNSRICCAQPTRFERGSQVFLDASYPVHFTRYCRSPFMFQRMAVMQSTSKVRSSSASAPPSWACSNGFCGVRVGAAFFFAGASSFSWVVAAGGRFFFGRAIPAKLCSVRLIGRERIIWARTH
mmetsp:Transcript_21395/g.31853  ORF Transcript_21395/g.31853 Transcript_21395/m.31853 type:complete len:257 (-) Transcript_21395:22-792(-)